MSAKKANGSAEKPNSGVNCEDEIARVVERGVVTGPHMLLTFLVGGKKRHIFAPAHIGEALAVARQHVMAGAVSA